MYTTRDLDKSTHKTRVCRISTRPEMEIKQETCRLQIEFKKKKNAVWFLDVKSHVLGICATYQLSSVANNLYILYTGCFVQNMKSTI